MRMDPLSSQHRGRGAPEIVEMATAASLGRFAGNASAIDTVND